MTIMRLSGNRLSGKLLSLLLIAICCFFSLNIFAQTRVDVRGIVLSDSAQTPIEGASVIVKGTRQGTVTNAKGEFMIANVGGNEKVEISSTGYSTREISVADISTSRPILLTRILNGLDEVIVTGFQTIQKKKFTGAAVTLKADDIKIDGITDVSRMLQGRAAGVSVQNVSGTFGTAPKIRIRGATSINGINKPLWVIDGVVLEDLVDVSNEQLSSGDLSTLLGSSVAGININDIETFDILKDASATAIYGARAMNGVVVITTKRGKASTAPLVSYNGSFSYQIKPSYSSFDIMNSSDMLSVYAEAYRKGYMALPELVNANSYGIYGKLADLIQHTDANGNTQVQNTPEAMQKWLLDNASQNTDWFDVLFKNSLVQTHSISISGGSEKIRNYFSGSYLNDPGWTIADRAKRITASFKNVYNLTSKLTTEFGTLLSIRDQKAPGTENRVSDPTRGIFDRAFDINPFSYSLNTSRTMPAYNSDGTLDYFRRNYAPFNIINESNTNYITLKNIDVTASGRLNYKILKNFSYEFLGSVRYVKSSREHQILENSNQAEAYRANDNAIMNGRNPYLYADPDNPGFPKIVVLPYGGFYNRYDLDLTNYTFRNTFNYSNDWGVDKKHQLLITAGQELRYIDRREFENLGVGYQYGNGGIPYNYYLYFKMMNETDSSYYGLLNYRERAVGFFGTATYTFLNKYNFTVTGRDDGSNALLSSRTRWTPTWTVAGSWNLDQENFIKNAGVFSHLIYKISYGLTALSGNATNSTAILRSKATRRINVGDQQPALYIDQLENAFLGLEKNYLFSTGLDMGFFRNRLNLNFEYYNRKSFDLIGPVKTAGIGGQITQSANYANMNSHGIDVAIDGKIVDSKNFSYVSTLNVGWNTSKIANLKSSPTIYDLIGEGGGAALGYPQRGLFSLSNEGLEAYDGVPNFLNQDGMVSSATNLMALNTKYLIYEGPVDPTIFGGFNNTFRYKEVSLTVYMTYQAGNKIRLTPTYKDGYGDLSSLPNEFKKRWTLGGDDQNTNFPSLADLFTQNSGSYGYLGIPAYPYDNYNFSHDRVADGGFIRLQAVTLSYKFKPELLKHAWIKGASISITGNNLWLIYSDSRLHGQDPEFFNTGGVALPVNRQITGSLNIQF